MAGINGSNHRDLHGCIFISRGWYWLAPFICFHVLEPDKFPFNPRPLQCWKKEISRSRNFCIMTHTCEVGRRKFPDPEISMLPPPPRVQSWKEISHHIRHEWKRLWPVERQQQQLIEDMWSFIFQFIKFGNLRTYHDQQSWQAQRVKRSETFQKSFVAQVGNFVETNSFTARHQRSLLCDQRLSISYCCDWRDLGPLPTTGLVGTTAFDWPCSRNFSEQTRWTVLWRVPPKGKVCHASLFRVRGGADSKRLISAKRTKSFQQKWQNHEQNFDSNMLLHTHLWTLFFAARPLATDEGALHRENKFSEQFLLSGATWAPGPLGTTHRVKAWAKIVITLQYSPFYFRVTRYSFLSIQQKLIFHQSWQRFLVLSELYRKFETLTRCSNGAIPADKTQQTRHGTWSSSPKIRLQTWIGGPTMTCKIAVSTSGIQDTLEYNLLFCREKFIDRIVPTECAAYCTNKHKQLFWNDWQEWRPSWTGLKCNWSTRDVVLHLSKLSLRAIWLLQPEFGMNCFEPGDCRVCLLCVCIWCAECELLVCCECWIWTGHVLWSSCMLYEVLVCCDVLNIYQLFELNVNCLCDVMCWMEYFCDVSGWIWMANVMRRTDCELWVLSELFVWCVECELLVMCWMWTACVMCWMWTACVLRVPNLNWSCAVIQLYVVWSACLLWCVEYLSTVWAECELFVWCDVLNGVLLWCVGLNMNG